MSGIIYLDNAATTRLRECALKDMLPYFTDNYSNPSAIYGMARQSRATVEHARENVANVINAKNNEIYFTSGGSESDNWAIKAAAVARKDVGHHIITCGIEHPAVLRTCEYLEKMGFEVTYLAVDSDGIISLSELSDAIRPDTILISLMAANNEIGSIQPIKEIGAIAKSHGILFHTDAVQAFGHITIDVKEMNIDMLSASAHKFGGPKGVGILYIRNDVKLGSFIHGGAQERGRRAGTLNTAGIVGSGSAALYASSHMAEIGEKVSKMRDKLIADIFEKIPDVRLNGSKSLRLPNNVNISFENVDSESLLILLDEKGICASGGSACSSGSLKPSHVLTAIGMDAKSARGALRMTLSEENTSEELDFVVEELRKIVERLRNMRKM